MSKSMKQNLIQVITWSTVAIGVLIVFTRPDTIQDWGDNPTKTLLLALLFLVGFGTDFAIRLMKKINVLDSLKMNVIEKYRINLWKSDM